MTQESERVVVETPVETDTTKIEITESEKPKEKTKERSRPPSKVVIRCLPPTLTKDMFIKQLSPLPEYDYLYFVRSDKSMGQFAFSRGYINFVNQEDVFTFKEKFDNYTFVDKKGNEYAAVVEFAPFQRLPKKRATRKKDPKSGTVEEDPAYVSFLETLNKEPPDPATTHSTLEYFPPADAEKVVTTPLLEFLKQRRAEKQRAREERREERRRKDQERKKRREGDREEGTVVKVLRNPDHDKEEPRGGRDRDKERQMRRREDDRHRGKDRDRDRKMADTRQRDVKGARNYREERTKVLDVRQRGGKPPERGKLADTRRSQELTVEQRRNDARKNSGRGVEARKPYGRDSDARKGFGREQKPSTAPVNKPVQETDKELKKGSAEPKDIAAKELPEKVKEDQAKEKDKWERLGAKPKIREKETKRHESDSDEEMLRVEGARKVVEAEELPKLEILQRRNSLESDRTENFMSPGRQHPRKQLSLDSDDANDYDDGDMGRRPPKKQLSLESDVEVCRGATTKRRGSLDSGDHTHGMKGLDRNQTSSDWSLGSKLERNLSLDLDSPDSRLDDGKEELMDKNGTDAEGKPDPRLERRIRNKDRPAMQIYRPGMGRFSLQRKEREKGGSGGTTEWDSPSPSPSPTPSNMAANKTSKRSVSREK